MPHKSGACCAIASAPSAQPWGARSKVSQPRYQTQSDFHCAVPVDTELVWILINPVLQDASRQLRVACTASAFRQQGRLVHAATGRWLREGHEGGRQIARVVSAMRPTMASATSSVCRCTTARPRSWPGAAPRSFSRSIWDEMLSRHRQELAGRAKARPSIVHTLAGRALAGLRDLDMKPRQEGTTMSPPSGIRSAVFRSCRFRSDSFSPPLPRHLMPRRRLRRRAKRSIGSVAPRAMRAGWRARRTGMPCVSSRRSGPASL